MPSPVTGNSTAELCERNLLLFLLYLQPAYFLLISPCSCIRKESEQCFHLHYFQAHQPNIVGTPSFWPVTPLLCEVWMMTRPYYLYQVVQTFSVCSFNSWACVKVESMIAQSIFHVRMLSPSLKCISNIWGPDSSQVECANHAKLCNGILICA